MVFRNSKLKRPLLMTTAMALLLGSGAFLTQTAQAAPPWLKGLELTDDQIDQLPSGLSFQLGGDHPSNKGDDDDDDDDSGDADAAGSVILGGVGTDAYDSMLRFSNFGTTAGMASVSVIDATTGDEIATFESGEVASMGAIEIPFVDVLGDADVPVDEEDNPVPMTAIVSGDFSGHVQHLAWFAGPGVLSDVTACGALETPDQALGYMAGPGREDVAGMVRVINSSPTAGDVTLVLRDAATGAELGEWTSPEIASLGAWDGSVSMIAGEAGIAEDQMALTLSIAPPPAGFDLSYLEGAGSSLTDLTAG